MKWERIEKQSKKQKVKVFHYLEKLLNNDLDAISIAVWSVGNS